MPSPMIALVMSAALELPARSITLVLDRSSTYTCLYRSGMSASAACRLAVLARSTASHTYWRTCARSEQSEERRGRGLSARALRAWRASPDPR